MALAMPMTFTDYQRETHEQLRQRRHYYVGGFSTGAHLALGPMRYSDWRYREDGKSLCA
jgi:hypothetical protein